MSNLGAENEYHHSQGSGMELSAAEQFLGAHAEVVQRLHEKSGAPAWQLSPERFACALARSVAHRFPGALLRAPEVLGYLDSLHLEDLALACACSDGHVPAWEHFMKEFRHELYRAGRAIAGEDRGRDLADSLYGELYGLSVRSSRGNSAQAARDGQRQSLFDYYYGRSKLITWLRAVLAQRHVDQFRETRRNEPLDDDDSPHTIRQTRPAETPDPDRRRYLALLHTALAEELAGLPARDRLRLSYYYVQELTLAQIGRLTGEHEATVSRKLERARREVRKNVEEHLRRSQRLSDAQISLCFEYALEDWPFDLSRALSE